MLSSTQHVWPPAGGAGCYLRAESCQFSLLYGVIASSSDPPDVCRQGPCQQDLFAFPSTRRPRCCFPRVCLSSPCYHCKLCCSCWEFQAARSRPGCAYVCSPRRIYAAKWPFEQPHLRKHARLSCRVLSRPRHTIQRPVADAAKNKWGLHCLRQETAGLPARSCRQHGKPTAYLPVHRPRAAGTSPACPFEQVWFRPTVPASFRASADEFFQRVIASSARIRPLRHHYFFFLCISRHINF